MSNEEHQSHKTGLMGELLVKLRLNAFGVNTGGVDKDTGTDIVMFLGEKILTAQVKSAVNNWNYDGVHGVNIHFRANLSRDQNNQYYFDQSAILWKRANTGEEFRPLSQESINKLF